ncbi:hypothetical protein [Neotabrizicola sp. sgz301269]|uniref:hypothetical protein n=1 Tax=Neotabrizicola sp. sgz301269 TaxID=3276282 RepID=UPI00376FDA0B
MPSSPLRCLSPLAALLLSLAACAPLPGATALPAATLGTPPVLLPLDQLLARANLPPRATETSAAALDGRAADLRRRTGAIN